MPARPPSWTPPRPPCARTDCTSSLAEATPRGGEPAAWPSVPWTPSWTSSWNASPKDR